MVRVLDVDCEARWVYGRAGFELDEVPAATKLARRLGVALRRVEGHLVRGGNACTITLHGVRTICLRRRLTREAARFAICHELAELRLAELRYEEPDVEERADELGAALACPRDAFRQAVREHGRLAFEQLALDFTIDETCAALRVGEAVGVPLAVVAPRRVRVRGDACAWPDEHTLRRVAKTGGPGVARAVLRDDPRRVVLVAEDAA